jgi:rSAM/selenodomain-associated transferase 2
MSISIIVPVLNEALLIQRFLENLRERATGAEIIVVDGGSSDGTAEVAAELCDCLIRSKPGRAVQMNAGADAAHDDILWFLHVDVRVPPQCLAQIEQALADPGVVGGFFRIHVPESSFIYRLTDSFAHYAGLLLRIRCGDHGFFCRRAVFEKIGGFPNVPLMEDADFYRKLRRAGRTIVLSERIDVDPRRFELIGPARLTFAFGLIGLLYFLRVPRRLLQSMYRRMCSRS